MDQSSVHESLKSLRFLHQLLMLVVAAVMILGLSPDPSRQYNAALKELTALKQLESGATDYRHFVFLQAIASSYPNSRYLLSIIRDSGATAAKGIRDTPVILGDWEFPQPDLMDEDLFLSGDQKLGVLEDSFSGTSKRRWIDRIKQQLTIQERSDPGTRLLTAIHPLIQGASTDSDGDQIMPWQNLTPERLAQGMTTLVFSGPTVSSFALSLHTPYQLVATRNGHFALSWLESTSAGRQILDPKSHTVFPGLKKLASWDRIRLMGTDSAIQYVQHHLDSIDAETISFFGISVSKTVAIWAGPLACLCIGFFLFLHLRSFRPYIQGSAHEPLEFPWVAIFPDLLSAAATYISLCALPTLASSLLLWQYGNLHDRSTVAGFAITGLTLAVGVFTAIELHRFRNKASQLRRLRLAGATDIGPLAGGPC